MPREYSHRVVAAVSADVQRQLSGPRLAFLGIKLARTIPELVSLVTVEPGGAVILDPALSDGATASVLEATARAGAELILLTTWDDWTIMRLWSILRTMVPLDTLDSAGAHAVQTRLIQLLTAPEDRSASLLVLGELVGELARLNERERNSILLLFATQQAGTSHPADGSAQRTLERHLRKAGLERPRNIARGAAVARARHLLREPDMSLEVVAERVGFRSVAGLSDAFRWGVSAPPREAARGLPVREFASRIARVLRTPTSSIDRSVGQK